MHKRAVKPRPNDSNMPTQHVATCWAQQCCDMLRRHVAIVWPGLNTLTKEDVQEKYNFLKIKDFKPLNNCTLTPDECEI